VRALVEAEAHPGPSLVIAYSHCIAHGYDLAFGASQQRLAVDSGVWPLYRYDPRRTERAEPPLVLDAVRGKTRVREYMRNEARFHMLERQDKPRFDALLATAEHMAERRGRVYEGLSRISPEAPTPAPAVPRIARDEQGSDGTSGTGESR
jgi:pyruvate-ferredoxin/flavodoxin oxidoreductase